ncbi:MAG: hypothetical protein HRT61_11740 [Ekhidna sp.]|nr:hypothetical protein [Ekhidna sp.]
MPDNKFTASDVQAGIFAKHSGPEWVTFSEVANSTGTNVRRRADAICMNIWPSKGYVIHGFEIKVSRADFLHEMKDITKSEEIGQYCDYWWLATPSGLVDVREVPEKWGLIELTKGGMRIKKQAPRKDAPKEIPRHFMAAMLRKAHDRDNAFVEAEISKQLDQIKEDAQRQAEYRLKSLKDQQKRTQEWIEKFEEHLGMEFNSFEKPDAFAERMRVAKSIEFGNVSRLMQTCAGVVREIGELGKAMPDGRE